MTFIETVPEAGAAGAVAEQYGRTVRRSATCRTSPRRSRCGPSVYAAWRQLNGAIKAGMDLRRYELATVAAARRLRSSYCMLAHGRCSPTSSSSPTPWRASRRPPRRRARRRSTSP